MTSIQGNQTLRKLIDEHNLPFGDTENGKNWCIKALHPSDPLTQVDGIPDDCVQSSILMNYQAAFTFTCNPTATGTWAFQGSIIPHPIGMACVNTEDNVGNQTLEFLNPEIAGATHAAKYGAYAALFNRWRLAYCGATIYQDGADLSNQGTITVCQRPLELAKLSIPFVNTGGTAVYAGIPCTYECGDWPPLFSNCQSMPNAYFNNSKFGAYAPMKLSNMAHRWISRNDAAMYGGSQAYVDGFSNTNVLNVAGASGTGGAYPFMTLSPPWAQPVSGIRGGDATSPFCNDFVIDFCAKNLAVTTSYTVFIRMGFECQVVPGTSMCPLQKLAPPMDPRASLTYQLISREMKDAYPADYNDWNKIWEVIKNGARTIAPLVAKVHPALGALFNAPDMIQSGYDALSSAFGSKKQTEKTVDNITDKAIQKTVSNAQVDRVKKQIAKSYANKERKSPKLNIKRPQQKGSIPNGAVVTYQGKKYVQIA